MPGVPENGTRKDPYYSYPEPTQVPLGEKPKVCGCNLIKGIRHISPEASVEGVPIFVCVYVRIQGAITRTVRLFNKNVVHC